MNMEALTITETDEVQWKHERDIPANIWNRYMKKFGKKYRLKKDELNIWNLRCKFGTVQLFSLLKHQLCFVGVFRSQQHLTWFKKSLKKLANQQRNYSKNKNYVNVIMEECLFSTVTPYTFGLKSKCSRAFPSRENGRNHQWFDAVSLVATEKVLAISYKISKN